MYLIFKNGLVAAKKNLAPGLILQGFALTLVLLYYFHGATHQLLLEIPKYKQQTGILFPLLTTAISGGLIPYIFLRIRKEIPLGRYAAHLLFMLGFWAFNGMTTDLFYRAQAVMFGDQITAVTIIKKVCFDQFVYNPIWVVPWTVTVMHWRNCDFSFRTAAATLSNKLFFKEMAAILLSTWSVWIPAVAIIYSLPLALQFPLFNIVLCFWSLLLTALSKEAES
jgi:hypothetical protein